MIAILQAFGVDGRELGHAEAKVLDPAELAAFLDALQLDDTPFPARIEARDTAGGLLFSKSPREIVTEAFMGDGCPLACELETLDAWAGDSTMISTLPSGSPPVFEGKI